MKILQLCVRFPPAPGGAETHVYSISKELIKRGHDVKVFTSDLYTETPFVRLDDAPDMVDGIPVKRFTTHTLGGEMHYVITPSLFWGSFGEDFDVVHAHSYGYFHVTVACMLRRLRGVPFVLTPHFHPEWSMWGGERRRKLRRIYDSFLAPLVLSSADRVIGVSEAEMSQLSRNLLDRSKTTIIPNGISPEDFESLPDGQQFRERYRVSGKMVLFVGRLATNKGLMTLVESIPMILEREEATFVLVGQDQGMKAKLMSKAKSLGVADTLRFTGHIEDPLVFKAAFASCDVFVLPSEYEAFGIVLLEAMMCEKPCVASDVGGVSEVVRKDETGLLVEYGKADDLADAIVAVLSNPEEARSMGRKGRERVLKYFTWEKVAARVEDVYNELV